MVKTFHLPNGVNGVCDERPRTGTVAIQIQFKTGTAAEPPEENGLTNLMQEATQGGTTTRSRDQIATAFETRGEALSSGTGAEATFFYVDVLASEAEGAFGALADVLRHPVFAPVEVKKTQEQIIQGLRGDAQDPVSAASAKFMEMSLGTRNFGNPAAGTEALVGSFTPAQVRRRHDEMLADTSGLIVSFSGDITAEQAEALSLKYFGDLPAAGAPKAPPPRAVFAGGDYREGNANEQLNLFLGFKAPGREDPDRYAALLLSEALSGGMSSPLFQEIREKRGLVYTVYSSYDPEPGDGIFSIYAGTGKGNAGELLKTAFSLLGGAAKDGFSDAEIAGARDRILRQRQFSSEKSTAAVNINAGMLSNYGRLVSDAEFEAKIRRVTGDDIRRVCAKMLEGGNYALSAVGPLDTLPPKQEIQGLMQGALEGVSVPEKKTGEAQLAAAFAAAAKKDQPALAPRVTVLPNGLRVVTIERPGPLSCGAWVGAGSDHETPVLSGATHMNEHMMFQGTPSYPPGEIMRVVEKDLLGLLNAATTHDRTFYYFYNLAPEALEPIVRIAGEMVFKADISQEQLDGRLVPGADGKAAKTKGQRDVVIEELRKDTDDVDDRTDTLMMALAYPDQPHGWDILGPEKGLRALHADQLRAYRDEFYRPNNVVFAAVGPVRHEDVVAAVQKKFGDLKPGPIAPLPGPEYKGGTLAVESGKAEVCNVMLAADGVKATDPDLYAYQALSLILTGGYASRLYTKAVSELGLTPGVRAGNQVYRNGGTFSIEAQAEPENVKPLINALYEGCRDVAQNLTEADLARARTAMEMGNLKALETAKNANNVIASQILTFGRLVPPAEISAAIQALTVDDIKRVAAKLLAQNPTAAMVVPEGTNPALLPTHEEVVAMRDGKYTPPPPGRKPAAPGLSL